MIRLSAAQARRVAIGAQLLAGDRPAGRVDVRHLRRVLDRLAVVQIDSVNVYSRAHYLPLFARLGPYPRPLLDRLTGYVPRPARAEMFEYWAHAASLVPVGTQPLLRWRMARAHSEPWPGIRQIGRDNPGFVEEMYDLVAANGPIRAGDTGIPRPAPRPGHMWNWHAGKVALEYLFYEGRITTAKRVNFERYYDLTERVLPAEMLAAPTPTDADATVGLVRLSGRALGVATSADLRDYFRISHAACSAAITTLVETGELVPVIVEGWDKPAYLWHEARRPRSVDARALLSPFDSLVWFRERTERLFDFHYRIEIYTREEHRRFGYYVLPFLLGDTLVGRVDLKADRQAGRLLVQSAWVEARQQPQVVARALAAELSLAAEWLGLPSIEVRPKGDLAPALRAVV